MTTSGARDTKLAGKKVALFLDSRSFVIGLSLRNTRRAILFAAVFLSVRAGMSADQPLVSLVQKADEADFERRFHEWEATAACATKWESIAVLEATTCNGKLELQADGSLRALAEIADKESYTVKARTALRDITAFRLEVFSHGKGDSVLTEFQVTAGAALAFANASADFAQEGFAVAGALDGDDKTGWAFARQSAQAHAAVFELKSPLVLGDEAVLTFTLRQDYGGGRCIARFRITATVQPSPVRELPECIRRTLALEPSERTEEQRAEIADYYRTIAEKK